MKKISGRIIALLLTVIMVSGTVVSADAGSDIKSAKTVATEARDTLEKYKSNLTTLNAQRKETNSRLSAADIQLTNKKKIYENEVKKAKKSSEFFDIQNSYDNSLKDKKRKMNIIKSRYEEIDDWKAKIELIKGRIEDAVEKRKKEVEKAYEDAWRSYNEYKRGKEHREDAYKSCEEKIKTYQTKLDTYNKQLKTAQANYDAVAGQYNEGMFGFLEWEQTAYPKYANDAKKALDILKNCRDAEYTHKGDPDDATFLDNIIYLEEFLHECNTLRQNDPNYNKKGEVLKVNNVAMAIAQSDANYAALGEPKEDGSNLGSWGMVYSDQFPVLQILDTGYDPYDGWYTAERKYWEEKGDDWEFWSGHYTRLMECGNPNLPTGLANGYGVNVQIFTVAGTEYANGPLIPISEYFSMLKEYENQVFPAAQWEKVQDLMTKIYNVEKSIRSYTSNLDIIKKDIDRFTTDMENALANVKKTQAYKDYHNMDKVLDKVRAEYKDDIEYVEKQIKALYDEIEQLQASLNGKDSYYAKVRKAYEKKLKDYPDVEKAYKAYMSAQATYDSCKEKLQKIDEKIKTLKEQIKTAQADYDKKLANYKKILSDNGLSYEDNKLEDPDPSAANPVKTITLKAKTSTTIMTGKQVQIAATVKPAEASQKLTWTSSNKSYATVNSNGLVTTKPAGVGKTVVIRATATDGSKKTNTIKLKIVKDGVTSIAINGNTSMNAGSSMKLTATVKTSGSTANKEIGWKSSNKDAANVTPDGVVHANEAGKGKTVTITAYSLDGTGIKKSIKISIN